MRMFHYLSTMSMVLYLLILTIFLVIQKINAECPNIITKAMWGGQLNQEVDFITIPTHYVIIAHTVSHECNTLTRCAKIVQNIQNYHINSRQYHDIGYNFLVGGDGNVYEGVGWNRVGAHSLGWNTRSVGIAFIGNFSENLPTPAALAVAKKLLECGIEKQTLSPNFKLIGHRQAIATQGPGTRLYMEIVSWPHWTASP